MSISRKGEPDAAAPATNRLIDALPRVPRTGVLARGDTVELRPGAVLCEAGQPFDYVYFPMSGSISLLRTFAGHPAFETENIGREGMLGLALLLEVNRAPQRGIVRAPCLALRMESRRLRNLLTEYAALRRVLQRYLYVVLAELSQSTGCVRFHDVGSRLARSLLRAQDRVQSDELPLLTHQFLAATLGVRRGSVTSAASSLQQRGVIRYSRGRIDILDRERLEAAACECYCSSVENYESLLG